MLNSLTGLDIAFIFISLLIGVTIHEMMHGYAAYWLGDTTAADMGRLTLNPLRSIDPLLTVIMPLFLIVFLHVPFFAAKPVPFNPARVKWDEYGAALVGLAGPAINLVLAVVGAVIFHLTGGAVGDFAYWFTFINIALAVFNLIPFPPLDGSRLLYAFAPEPVQAVMRNIESAGFVAILFFIFVVFQFIAGPIISLENHLLILLLG